MNLKNQARAHVTTYRVQTPFRLVWDHQSHISMTECVSSNGLTVLTDAMPPLKTPVQVIVHLPGRVRAVSLNAYVVQIGLCEDSSQAVLGLRLFQNEPDTNAAWAQLIATLRVAGGCSCVREISPTLICLRPESVDAIKEIQWRAEFGARTFVLTEVALVLGEAVRVALVHPRSYQLIVLEAVVQEVHSSGQMRGAVVSFAPLDAADTREIRRFVETGKAMLRVWGTQAAWAPQARPLGNDVM